MTTIGFGIRIPSLKFLYVRLAAHNARHNNLVKWNAFYLQAIKEVTTNVLQQNGCMWHQIRNAALQSIYIKKWIGTHIYQLCLATFCLFAIGNRLNSPMGSRSQLHIILVGKGLGKVGNTIDTILHLTPIGMKEARSRSSLRWHVGRTRWVGSTGLLTGLGRVGQVST